MLKGYKTYVIAGLVGIVATTQTLGYIDSATATTLYGLLGAGGLASLRAGISNG